MGKIINMHSYDYDGIMTGSEDDLHRKIYTFQLQQKNIQHVNPNGDENI